MSKAVFAKLLCLIEYKFLIGLYLSYFKKGRAIFELAIFELASLG